MFKIRPFMINENKVPNGTQYKYVEICFCA